MKEKLVGIQKRIWKGLQRSLKIFANFVVMFLLSNSIKGIIARILWLTGNLPDLRGTWKEGILNIESLYMLFLLFLGIVVIPSFSAWLIIRLNKYSQESQFKTKYPKLSAWMAKYFVVRKRKSRSLFYKIFKKQIKKL